MHFKVNPDGKKLIKRLEKRSEIITKPLRIFYWHFLAYF